MTDYIKKHNQTLKEAHIQMDKGISNFASAHVDILRKLVNFLYKQGFTEQQIADDLHLTRQRINQLYPKRSTQKENE